VTQVIEHMFSKCKVLSSTPSAAKQNPPNLNQDMNPRIQPLIFSVNIKYSHFAQYGIYYHGLRQDFFIPVLQKYLPSFSVVSNSSLIILY
jgi:hypothetical protein